MPKSTIKKTSLVFQANDGARDINHLQDRRPSYIAGQWIPYGTSNDFPDYLNMLYTESAQMNSIVDSLVDYICGEDVTFNFTVLANNHVSLKRIFRRAVFDKVLYGGYALKLIYNRLGEIAKVEWVDFRNLRFSDDEHTLLYSETWTRGRRGELERYSLFEDFRFGEDPNNAYACIYYDNSNSRYLYPQPLYIGSIRSIETSIQIDKYHFSAIQRNLTASTLININDASYTETEKKEIDRRIRENFTGSENAGSVMVTFNESAENAPTVTRLEDDNTDAKYQALRANTRDNIFIGFRIPPIITGMPPENGGFSKEEYVQAFDLYNTTMVMPLQKQMINAFDDIFGVKESINITPFDLKINTNDSEL